MDGQETVSDQGGGGLGKRAPGIDGSAGGAASGGVGGATGTSGGGGGGPPGGVGTGFARGPVYIIWDMDDVALPERASATFAVKSILLLAEHFGVISSFKCVCKEGSIPFELKRDLQESGVTVEEVFSEKMEAADIVILTTLLSHALERQREVLLPSDTDGRQSQRRASTATLIMISGDRDFTRALTLIRRAGLFSEILLLHHSSSAESLRNAATQAIDFGAFLLNCQSALQRTSFRDRAVSYPPAQPTSSSSSSSSIGGGGGGVGGPGGAGHSGGGGASGSWSAMERRASAPNLGSLSEDIITGSLRGSTDELNESSDYSQNDPNDKYEGGWDEEADAEVDEHGLLRETGSMMSGGGGGHDAGLEQPPASYSAVAAGLDTGSAGAGSVSGASAIASKPIAAQGSSTGGALPPITSPTPQELREMKKKFPELDVSLQLLDKVMNYCKEEKIIPREAVVRRRAESHLKMKVKLRMKPRRPAPRPRGLQVPLFFEEWLQMVQDSRMCHVLGTSPHRLIWPLNGKFDCADYFRPVERLSLEDATLLLQFLERRQPEVNHGRYGFANFLQEKGPDRIRALPHGYLIELVQLLLNKHILSFDKGTITYSPLPSRTRVAMAQSFCHHADKPAAPTIPGMGGAFTSPVAAGANTAAAATPTGSNSSLPAGTAGTAAAAPGSGATRSSGGSNNNTVPTVNSSQGHAPATSTSNNNNNNNGDDDENGGDFDGPDHVSMLADKCVQLHSFLGGSASVTATIADMPSAIPEGSKALVHSATIIPKESPIYHFERAGAPHQPRWVCVVTLPIFTREDKESKESKKREDKAKTKPVVKLATKTGAAKSATALSSKSLKEESAAAPGPGSSSSSNAKPKFKRFKSTVKAKKMEAKQEAALRALESSYWALAFNEPAPPEEPVAVGHSVTFNEVVEDQVVVLDILLAQIGQHPMVYNLESNLTRSGSRTLWRCKAELHLRARIEGEEANSALSSVSSSPIMSGAPNPEETPPSSPQLAANNASRMTARPTAELPRVRYPSIKVSTSQARKYDAKCIVASHVLRLLEKAKTKYPKLFEAPLPFMAPLPGSASASSGGGVASQPAKIPGRVSSMWIKAPMLAPSSVSAPVSTSASPSHTPRSDARSLKQHKQLPSVSSVPDMSGPKPSHQGPPSSASLAHTPSSHSFSSKSGSPFPSRSRPDVVPSRVGLASGSGGAALPHDSSDREALYHRRPRPTVAGSRSDILADRQLSQNLPLVRHPTGDRRQEDRDRRASPDARQQILDPEAAFSRREGMDRSRSGSRYAAGAPSASTGSTAPPSRPAASDRWEQNFSNMNFGSVSSPYGGYPWQHFGDNVRDRGSSASSGSFGSRVSGGHPLEENDSLSDTFNNSFDLEALDALDPSDSFEVNADRDDKDAELHGSHEIDDDDDGLLAMTTPMTAPEALTATAEATAGSRDRSSSILQFGGQQSQSYEPSVGANAAPSSERLAECS